MSEYSDPWEDEKENRQKDFLIAKCPTLRIFLDTESSINKKNWLQKIKDHPQPMLDKSVDIIKIGAEDAIAERIFFSDINVDDAVTGLKAIASIGYELGTPENANLFYGDIYETMVNQEVMRNTYEGAALTLSLLQQGASLSAKAIDDVPPEFRGFTFDLD